mmetsp:Transcript_13989/g.25247  ORF Transcript_13989/g.25247 Transcript_13989/m.25247 type:complete len:92 (-) Transcript_13989:168-443(-)
MKNSCRLYIDGENHTIGNIIHYFLKKNFFVSYCSYDMPHPLRDLIFYEIQFKKQLVITLFVRSLFEDIGILCEHIIVVYLKKWQKFVFNYN